MAIMDGILEFSDKQALKMAQTASTQTVSTNSIDLGATNLDIGAGTPLYLNIRIVSAPGLAGYPSTGETTSSFRLQGCDTLTGPNTGPIYNQSDLRLLDADLKAGKWIMRKPIAYGIKSRFLQLIFANNRSTATTWGATTLGYFDAWISGATPETDVGT